jgi:hypothetical protein
MSHEIPLGGAESPEPKPLAQILDEIKSSKRYSANVLWGKPRGGHPEGTVANHIRELEANLARISYLLDEQEILQQQILIHVHDTFKREAVSGSPIEDPESHASLAATFLAEVAPEQRQLILITQYHDEMYAIWRRVRGGGSHDRERIQKLVGKISEWDTFATFLLIDNLTAGKNREPTNWALDVLEQEGCLSPRVREIQEILRKT